MTTWNSRKQQRITLLESDDEMFASSTFSPQVRSTQRKLADKVVATISRINHTKTEHITKIPIAG